MGLDGAPAHPSPAQYDWPRDSTLLDWQATQPMIGIQVGNYKQVFQSSRFAYFWTGFALSGIGNAMTRIALTWYVWETTHSSQALGLLAFLFMAPIIVGGMLAGWMLDRFGRRRVMIIDNLVRGFVVGAIPLLYFVGFLDIWHVYAVAALHGLLMMISLAGGPSIIPALVSRNQLSTANALETIGFTISSAVGPPVAGFLIPSIGAPNVLIIDAVTFFAFAWALTRIPKDVGAPSGDRHDAVSYGIGDAVKLFLTNRVLLSTTLMYMAANIGLGMLSVWLPIYADDYLGGGAELFGTLAGLMAVGSVIGSLIAGSVVFPFTFGLMICFIMILAGASLSLALTAQTVWMAGTGLTLYGFFSSPMTIFAQTLRMQIIPEPLRGRAFALLRMLMQSGTPVGGIIAGPLLPVVGMTVTIGLSAGLITAPGLAGLRVTDLRTMRVPEASDAVASAGDDDG